MTAMKESKCKCRMQLWGMLGCILLATACKEANEQPLAGGSYETMKVTVSDQELNTAYSATIRGRQDIDIYPQVSGTIQELCVAEGEKVRTGQTLFIIDQVPYRAALNTLPGGTEHRHRQREVGTSGIGDSRTNLREQQGTAQKHKQRIDFVVVQAAPDGQHICILHHAEQRMLVFQPHITAVVVGILYFQYLGHKS